MVKPSRGTVVLIPFPFSDLSQNKLRPAAILADAGRGDFILCQITSNPWGDPLSVEIPPSAFKTGGLPLTSYARPTKLFTAAESLFVKEAGRLTESSIAAIVAQTIKILRG